MKQRPPLYHPVDVVRPETLGLKLKLCKHCGGPPEIRTQRVIRAGYGGMVGWIVCTMCSIQTMKYGLTDAMLKFLAHVWNRSARDGSVIEPPQAVNYLD